MKGARVLVQTLKAKGCRTVLVTGGFHQFADPVAEQLGSSASWATVWKWPMAS
jgi:phosphoserine phosphatase